MMNPQKTITLFTIFASSKWKHHAQKENLIIERDKIG